MGRMIRSGWTPTSWTGCRCDCGCGWTGSDAVVEFLVNEALVLSVEAAEARVLEDDAREARNRERVERALADARAGR